MRAVGAQERGVQLPGQIPVGAVASLAGHEAKIFAARMVFSVMSDED